MEWLPITKDSPPCGILIETCVMEGGVACAQMLLQRTNNGFWKNNFGKIAYHTPTHYQIDQTKKRWFGIMDYI